MKNIILVVALVAMMAGACALPDVAVQTQTVVAEATGEIQQDSSNVAAQSGSDTIYVGSITQVGASDSGPVTQSASNDVATNGDGVWIGEEIRQGGSGSTVTQTGNNDWVGTGDDSVVTQAVVQSSVVEGDSTQTADNNAAATGNDVAIGQLVSSAVKADNAVQDLDNSIAVNGDNPVTTQVITSSAIVDDLTFGTVSDPITNTLTVNIGSDGGMSAQDIAVIAVGDVISQITDNLIEEA